MDILSGDLHMFTLRCNHIRLWDGNKYECDLCSSRSTEVIHYYAGPMIQVHVCDRCLELDDKVFAVTVRLYLATKEA